MRNDFSTARGRMINEQLIPRGISDPRVIEVMAEVPRHVFVEDALQGQAYGDFALPIGEGQTISQPYIVALMTQALGLKPDHNVLEIGTGCGYQSAVLSRLCARVYTIERIKPLLIRARRAFDALHYVNILSRLDDGTLGWPEMAPYDAIIVTAAGPEIPAALVEQLADPGTLVIPVGSRGSQELVRLRKEDGRQHTQVIEQVRFVPLIGKQGWQPEAPA